MQVPASIDNAARKRVAMASPRIRASWRQVVEGNPLGAEPEQDRLLRRLQAKAGLSREEAEAVRAGILAKAAGPRERKRKPKQAGAERIYGNTIDFVGIAFLERGQRAAQAVARVAFRDGRPQGSGFMVSDRLFLTNNHVISSAAEAAQFLIEFDYELDPADTRRDITRFSLDPASFFVTDHQDDLDYTLVAVGPRESGTRELGEYGWCGLSDATDKHALGEIANIVQHPDGRYKEVVLRENRLVSRLSTVLHYVADTEPGSSGSPVFNNEWRVVALHHWGGPWRQQADDQGQPLPREINEGIRTSAIVTQLRQRAASLDVAKRALLDRVLAAGESASVPATRAVGAPGPNGAHVPNGGSAPSLHVADGRLIWQLPIEVSVRLPGLGAAQAQPSTSSGPHSGAIDRATPRSERRVEVDPDYDNRPGYSARFIDGFQIELPTLSSALKAVAARKRDSVAGQDPFELKYQHFSVVMNRKRRLAIFTACNIDGRSAKSVDRKTGDVTPRLPGGGEALEAAEASEVWFEDGRLDAGQQTNQELYSSQEVPGFPNKRTKAWQDRMFQRGHLVRRADPAWGTDKRALKADADTFHFTNCTPQVGFFNMGSAPKGTPRSGGGQLWRAIEDYVLDNAVDEQQRVCVFTGPVLDDAHDPLWRDQVIEGFRVPMRFWKIVAWEAAGSLHATAVIADQRPVIEVMPEAFAGAEVFADTSKVKDFLARIGEVERLTGLAFGEQLRDADILGGERVANGSHGDRRRNLRVEDLDRVLAVTGNGSRVRTRVRA
jgi:endonuclease G